MIADLAGGLARKFPGLAVDPDWFRSTTTIGDVIAQVGGRPADEAIAATDAPAPVVAPQSQIAKFPEVLAFADRLKFPEGLGIDNPYFVLNDGITRDTSIVNGEPVLNFSSFNYLGMSGHPDVAAAIADAATRYGSSCSASRVLSGEKPVHLEPSVLGRSGGGTANTSTSTAATLNCGRARCPRPLPAAAATSPGPAR
jgi:hypothetical protein